MKNFLLKIAYDGSEFLGWQKTKMGLSVEETLETILKRILNQEEVPLQAASRTDKGVHADEQMVNFFVKESVSERDLIKSLNALLPKNIAALSVTEVDQKFHPTLNATHKIYHYFVCLGPYQLPKYRHYSWHVPYKLDLELMRKGTELLLGEQDFQAFCNFRKNLKYEDTKRKIFNLSIHTLENERLKFEISGDHFLYKMVRNLIGTLVYVGRGKILLEAIPQILASRDRKYAGITAPAHGLFLHKVFYTEE